MSEWSASQRHELAPAPGGLGLVHDFLNTVAVHDDRPDLLSDATLARHWLAAAVRAWSELRGAPTDPPTMTEADLPKLRALRDTISQLVRGEAATGPGASMVSASFALSASGEVRLEPAGSGWRWLAAALWGEIMLSQQAGTWRRLKQCHNHPCESTFYDRSKNNSGVWCNVKTCGNVANLRASRARRRERERAAGDARLSPAPGAGAAGRAPS
ncbi:CGNR zinc finger domain-containing protein [Mycobacterium sp. Aquia_216]|uniref:CGNR zinc finger domain-containing protein n=1 Tax=Mycobacterium sp. Aquia_216 TaxID=2991729 RepID=UPI00227B76A5|nr:CGNR zinc finger domain-containing protein [Mycobacterium sp. Aquia_216]WAJ45476.1 CGNR zinc finger domain-containing protein [Mycobacterium sp. Aquia_216]